MEDIKNGQKIVECFFSEMLKIQGVDKSVAIELKKLYDENKFTNINITNTLSDLRVSKINED